MIARRAPVRERPSLRWIAAGLAVALIAAVGGWLVAHRIAINSPATTAPTDKVLKTGAARLRVSSDWQSVARPPALPGLSGAPAWRPFTGLSTTVSVALLPAEHTTLVPSGLVKGASGGLPAPQSARLVGLEA